MSGRDERAAVILPTATYKEAYARLSAVADRLKAQGGSADVDALAQDIREARAAHAVCKARLEAVRAEIEAELAEPDPDASPGNAVAAAAS